MDVKARVGLAIVTAVPALWLAAAPATASPAGTTPRGGTTSAPARTVASSPHCA